MQPTAPTTTALERILSPREASQILGVAIATLSKWRHMGYGGPRWVSVGARKRGYLPSALRAFVREHTSTADHEGTPLASTE